jgi:hypothetical protein
MSQVQLTVNHSSQIIPISTAMTRWQWTLQGIPAQRIPVHLFTWRHRPGYDATYWSLQICTPSIPSHSLPRTTDSASGPQARWRHWDQPKTLEGGMQQLYACWGYFRGSVKAAACSDFESLVTRWLRSSEGRKGTIIQTGRIYYIEKGYNGVLCNSAVDR